MKPERASRGGKHCWTHGENDGYTSGSQSGVQGHIETNGDVPRDPQQNNKCIYLLQFNLRENPKK